MGRRPARWAALASAPESSAPLQPGGRAAGTLLGAPGGLAGDAGPRGDQQLPGPAAEAAVLPEQGGLRAAVDRALRGLDPAGSGRVSSRRGQAIPGPAGADRSPVPLTTVAGPLSSRGTPGPCREGWALGARLPGESSGIPERGQGDRVSWVARRSLLCTGVSRASRAPAAVRRVWFAPSGTGLVGVPASEEPGRLGLCVVCRVAASRVGAPRRRPRPSVLWGPSRDHPGLLPPQGKGQPGPHVPTFRPYLLALLTHQSNWSTLHQCIRVLLGKNREHR